MIQIEIDYPNRNNNHYYDLPTNISKAYPKRDWYLNQDTFVIDVEDNEKNYVSIGMLLSLSGIRLKG